MIKQSRTKRCFHSSFFFGRKNRLTVHPYPDDDPLITVSSWPSLSTVPLPFLTKRSFDSAFTIPDQTSLRQCLYWPFLTERSFDKAIIANSWPNDPLIAQFPSWPNHLSTVLLPFLTERVFDCAFNIFDRTSLRLRQCISHSRPNNPFSIFPSRTNDFSSIIFFSLFWTKWSTPSTPFSHPERTILQQSIPPPTQQPKWANFMRSIPRSLLVPIQCLERYRRWYSQPRPHDSSKSFSHFPLMIKPGFDAVYGLNQDQERDYGDGTRMAVNVLLTHSLIPFVGQEGRA